jgi:hypothetical protein
LAIASARSPWLATERAMPATSAVTASALVEIVPGKPAANPAWE